MKFNITIIIISFIFFSILCHSCKNQESASLYFNYGEVDITPDESVTLSGYANRLHDSQGIHAPLTSRCLVLKEKRNLLCLIVNDLVGISDSMYQAILDEITGETDIDEKAIIITSIHTHSAPVFEYGISKANDRYTKYAFAKIVDNAIKTILTDQSFEKGFIRTGTGSCGINAQRKLIVPNDGSPAYRISDPEGIRDKQVNILQIQDAKGNNRVALFNYACHPVTLGYKSIIVSPDFPGKAREFIENTWGGHAIFLNGAAGDLNPIKDNITDTQITDSMGEDLGNAVISAEMKNSKPGIQINLKSGSILIPFRDQQITKEFIHNEVERKSKEVTEFIFWKDALLNWEKQLSRQIDLNEIKKDFSFDIKVLNMGSLIFFFTQGEAFVKYQLELKKRFPDKQIFFVGYCFGEDTYIPSSEAFLENGYETTQAYIFEGLPSPVSNRIEEIYLNKAEDIIQSLLK